MKFEKIHPFCRFAQTVTIDNEREFPPSIPLDARLFFTTSGESTIWVNGQEYCMEPGDILFIPVGTKYHIKTPEHAVQYIILNFDFTYERADRTLPIVPMSSKNYDASKLPPTPFFEDFPEFNRPLYLKKLHQTESFFRNIEREHLWHKSFFLARMSSLLLLLLIELARIVQSSSSKRTTVDERMDNVLSYIHVHFAEELDNTKLGEQFSFHPNYLSQLMVQYTNMSLHQYVLFLRISKARELLENTGYSITHIANAVGFNSSAYFSAYFKKVVGISPQIYRKRI